MPFHERAQSALSKLSQEESVPKTIPSKYRTSPTPLDDDQGADRSKCHPQNCQNQSRKHRKARCYFCWQLGHCMDQCWVFRKFVSKGIVVQDSEKRSYHLAAYKKLPEGFMTSSPPCEHIQIWAACLRASETKIESSTKLADEGTTPVKFLERS